MNLETVHVRHLWLAMVTSLDIRSNGYLIDKNEKIVYGSEIRTN